MAWTIDVSNNTIRSLRKMDKQVAKKIKRELESIAELDDPRSKGKALKGNLAGLWRYRIDDYRVICDIQDTRIVIVVIDVGHRSNVYKRF